MAVDFSATPLVGYTPQDVAFTDLTTSTSAITAWLWSFGDGGTSTIQNPTHTYLVPGEFDVSLTVDSPAFSSKKVIGYVPATGPDGPYTVGIGAVPFTPEGGYLVHVLQSGDYASIAVKVYLVAGDGTVTYYSGYGAAGNEPGCRSSQVDIDGYMQSKADDSFYYETNPQYTWNEGPTGELTTFVFIPGSGDWFGHTQCRFCKLGENFYFGGSSTGSKKIYRFNRGGTGTGAPAAISAPLGNYVTHVVTDGTNVYAIGIDGVDVYVLDAMTLAPVSTIATPLDPANVNTQPYLTIDRATNDVYLIGTVVDDEHTWKLNSDGTWTVVYDVTYADNIPGQIGAYEGHLFEMAIRSDLSGTPTDWKISEMVHESTLVKPAYIDIASGLGVRLPELLMPADLSFLSDGYQVQIIDVYGNVGWSTGEDSKRKVYTVAPRIVTVSMDLSTSQMKEFYDWFENTLNVGEEWFSCQLANFGPGLLWFKCRFYTPYVATPDAIGTRWLVKYNLYVLGEGQVLPPIRTSFASNHALLLEGTAGATLDLLFSSNRVLALATMNYAFNSNRSLKLEVALSLSALLTESSDHLLQETGSLLLIS